MIKFIAMTLVLTMTTVFAAPKGKKVNEAKPVATAPAMPSVQASPAAAPATDDSKYSRWAIGAELLGAGILASGMISYRPLDLFAINVQGSYISGTASATSGTTTASATYSIFMLPVTGSLLLGGMNHKFEALGGAILAFVSGTVSASGASGAFSGNGAVPIVGGGYRYQPHDGGFFFRLTGYYIIAPSGGTSAGWAGLTLGYAFSG